MATSEGVTVSSTNNTPSRRLATILRSQMRNIAPFLTLIFLSGVFAAASPSFATLDNFGNILTQVSVTGIIAVGLTFVILCAEIDLSVAAIANVTGIAVAYFTQQDSYVNIANIPMAGWAAILLALLLCALLGLVNALGLTVIGIPSFIMTLAMMHLGAARARPDRLQGAWSDHDARLGVDRRHPLDRDRRGAHAARRSSGADLYPFRPLRLHGGWQPRGGRIFRP
jgi:ribose transport system permease protein